MRIDVTGTFRIARAQGRGLESAPSLDICPLSLVKTDFAVASFQSKEFKPGVRAAGLRGHGRKQFGLR
jgi:hypothetical protein